MAAIGSVHSLCLSLAFLFLCLDYSGSNGQVLSVAGRQLPGLLQHVIFLPPFVFFANKFFTMFICCWISLRCSVANICHDAFKMIAISIRELVM